MTENGLLGLHGLVAEFATPDGLVKACRKASPKRLASRRPRCRC